MRREKRTVDAWNNNGIKKCNEWREIWIKICEYVWMNENVCILNVGRWTASKMLTSGGRSDDWLIAGSRSASLEPPIALSPAPTTIIAIPIEGQVASYSRHEVSPIHRNRRLRS